MREYNHIDIEQLKLVSDGNNQLLTDLVMMYQTQSVIFSQQFDELVHKKDFQAIGKLAHKVKGSVSTVGITALANEMKEFESNISTNLNEQSCLKLIEKFNTISRLAIEELNHYVKNYIKNESL